MPWPAANTALKAKPERMVPAVSVAHLRRGVYKADDAVVHADAHAVAARRAADKVEVQVDKLHAIRLSQSIGGSSILDDEAYEQFLQNRAEVDCVYELASKRLAKLHQAQWDAELAAGEARREATLAR